MYVSVRLVRLVDRYTIIDTDNDCYLVVVDHLYRHLTCYDGDAIRCEFVRNSHLTAVAGVVHVVIDSSNSHRLRRAPVVIGPQVAVVNVSVSGKAVAASLLLFTSKTTRPTGFVLNFTS